jgi:hypothetical protein
MEYFLLSVKDDNNDKPSLCSVVVFDECDLSLVVDVFSDAVADNDDLTNVDDDDGRALLAFSVDDGDENLSLSRYDDCRSLYDNGLSRQDKETSRPLVNDDDALRDDDFCLCASSVLSSFFNDDDDDDRSEENSCLSESSVFFSSSLPNDEDDEDFNDEGLMLLKSSISLLFL